MLLAESAPSPPGVAREQVSETEFHEALETLTTEYPAFAPNAQTQDADWQLGGPLSGAVLAACWRWRQGEALWQSTEAALLSSIPSASESQGGDSSSQGSLIIFDWDDTLFPTTFLSMTGRLLCPDGEAAAAEDLITCATAARQALRVAKRLGKVIIVTNAIRGWVQEMVTRFLPILEPELLDVPVVSARSIYEPQGILEPSRWKPLCFRRVMDCLQGCMGLRNVVSIGDSWFERQAVLSVGEELNGTCHVKSLKLLGMPSVDDLSRQLDLCSRSFEWIFGYDGPLDLWLHPMGSIEAVSPEVLAGTWSMASMAGLQAPAWHMQPQQQGEPEEAEAVVLEDDAATAPAALPPPPPPPHPHPDETGEGAFVHDHVDEELGHFLDQS